MSKNSIILKRYNNVQIEAEANVDLKPGKLVALNSSGKLILATGTTNSKNYIPMFVLEDSVFGKTISDDVKSGEKARVIIPQRGDEVLAWVNIDASGTITANSLLGGADSGNLIAYAGGAEVTNGGATIAVPQPLEIVAMALETVANASNAHAIVTRIKVMIV